MEKTKRCVAKVQSGDRCENPAMAYSNYCQIHLFSSMKSTKRVVKKAAKKVAKKK
jgi:hypothetical protein